MPSAVPLLHSIRVDDLEPEESQMTSTQPTSDEFPGSRLLPSRWAELGARAFGWLFGDARGNGDSVLRGGAGRGERGGAAGATESESARKLRFWFTERNRDTL